MANDQKRKLSSKLTVFTSIIRWIFTRLSKLIDRLLFNKRGSVIISFILAVAICVGINFNDISIKLFNDTTTTIEIQDVEVDILADTDKYEISGVPTSANVSITGQSADVQVFRSKGNIKIEADLRKCSVGDNVIYLEVKDLPDTLKATIDPTSVDVTIAKKVTKTFTIQPELLVGSNQKTSDYETPTLDTSVKITGAQDQINSIRVVKALIDCTGQVDDFEYDAPLVAYDAKGNKLNVTIDPETVHVAVSKTDSE